MAKSKGYGSLGVLSKKEAELEKLVDAIKNADTLKGIAILKKFAVQLCEKQKIAVGDFYFGTNNGKDEEGRNWFNGQYSGDAILFSEILEVKNIIDD